LIEKKDKAALMVHERLTHIQFHASPATDITLSFHIH